MLKFKLVFPAIAILVGVCMVSVFFEIALRFFPVYEGSYRLPVNQNNPVLRFEPNREYYWSSGWNFELVNKVKTNNYGYISHVDYNSQETTPLMAIIGDSYVEAAMVPYWETIAGRLNEVVSDERRVYSFGVSGAPLSQYLVFAEYAKKEFNPDFMIFVIIGNDFDESLLKSESKRGHHFFSLGPSGVLSLTRVDFEVSWIKKILRKSSLVRYGVANLEIQFVPARMKAMLLGKTSPIKYVGNTRSDASLEKVKYSEMVIDKFFNLLQVKTALNPGQVLFIIDGMRPSLYNEKEWENSQKSYFGLMRKHFILKAKRFGYEIVDMDPVFKENFQKVGKRFEFKTDAHWSSYGHEVSFEEITKTKIYKRFMEMKGKTLAENVIK